MLTLPEKILFEKFPEMPLSIRVFTYLVVLFLFIYLTLIPRFIDSQVVFKDPAGGMIPYRGAEVLMHIDGRDYKFMTNEYGYVSIPIVSRLPESLEIRINNVDLDKELPVQFNILNAWKKGPLKIILSDSDIKIASSEDGQTKASLVMNALNYLRPFNVSTVQAGMLSFKSPHSALTQYEKKNVRNIVISTVSLMTGVQEEIINDNYPFNGDSAPSYVQRIKIINSLENYFTIIIPDEHWKSLENIGQLVDYIQTRQLLNRSIQEQYPKKTLHNWTAIQQSLPPEQRPIFKR